MKDGFVKELLWHTGAIFVLVISSFIGMCALGHLVTKYSQKTEWRAVDATLPAESGYYTIHLWGEYVRCAWYDQKRNEWYHGNGANRTPDHWTTMPEPPQ